MSASIDKKFVTNYSIFFFITIIATMIVSCGYVWQGQENFVSKKNILGDGTQTLRFNNIEQSTLYSWIPYIIRSEFRNEIIARKLAVWVDSDVSDYALTVKMNSFQIRSAGEYKQRNLLFTSIINMEIIVYDGKTNIELWRSEPIIYSENYDHANEEYAIKQLIITAIRRCIDRLQQRF